MYIIIREYGLQHDMHRTYHGPYATHEEAKAIYSKLADFEDRFLSYRVSYKVVALIPLPENGG